MLIQLTSKILAVVPITCAMTKTIPSASELDSASELGKQLYYVSKGHIFISKFTTDFHL